MFKWAIISDEISQNLRKAIEVYQELSIPGIELRLIEGENVVNFERKKIYEIAKMIKEAGLKVCCIASPLFKECELNDKIKYKANIELLKKTIEVAKELDTHLIRCFAFSKKGQREEKNVLDEVVKQFAEPVRIAESGGVIIAVENDLNTFAETGRELSQLLKSIGSETVRALWDPVNAFLAGENPFSGYEKVKDLMVHLHVKDILVKGRTLEQIKFVPVGDGKINWIKQFEVLLKHGYEGYASFETSYRRREGEKAGEDATKRSYNNCLRILDKLSDGR